MFSKMRLGLLLLAVIFPTAYSKDETLEERSVGKEVTEAVLRRISRSEIFPEDNSFLIRLAYVESRFGTFNNTFREDFFGGIWQVDESVFRVTQTNHSSLNPLHANISAKFGIDWSGVTWRQLTRPLYSGLAAALYFARVPETIPQRIPGQADHWRKYYRPLGDITKFQNDAEELRNQTRCRGKMDLCIVLDSSGSINQLNPLNYRRAKDFTASMIESFTLDFTRIGMQIFSTTTQVIFEINNNKTIRELSSLARDAPYLNRGTRTDLAIKLAIQMFNRSSAIVGNGAPKIMTVFTDGGSDFGSDMAGAIRQIRNSDIKPISIGIGGSINQAELHDIALGDSQSVFMLNDFDGLQDFLQQITSVTCDIPQAPVLNTTYNDSLIQNEKRIYRIEAPPEGITINVTVSEGKTNGFWSHTEEVPSAAVHDGTLNENGPTFIPAPAQSRQGEGGESQSAVYFTIQGVEETNEYLLAMVEGNKAGDGGSDSGAPNSSVVNCVAFLLIFLHIVLT